MDVAQIRKDYSRMQLLEADVDQDPLRQFEKWLNMAIEALVPEPTAMTLSTVDGKIPSSRVVLLRGIVEQGFVFFTNYKSRKGREIAGNEYGALNFFWPELERQVRIVGAIVKSSAEISDNYFNSRPINSRIGSWASPQSEIISSREWLDDREQELKRSFDEANIRRPDFWGGYVLMPFEIEFWQGRPSRLHDRLQYVKVNNEWIIRRLAP